MQTNNILEVQGLKKSFRLSPQHGVHKRVLKVHAIDGIDLTIAAGETLGLVGESGCGKSTVGRCILRLIEPDAGDILLAGRSLLSLKGADLRAARRSLGVVFQDPFAAFNPRQKVANIVAEPLLAHNLITTKAELHERVLHLLQSVGLPPDALNRYPHEFSGGQRQRIGIARAIATSPQLLLLDEPTSALDISIRAQVLNLLLALQENRGIAYLLISHDLPMVGHLAHKVAVMYMGKIVEEANVSSLFARPVHPYTHLLLAVAPRPSPNRRRLQPLPEAEPPNPAELPTGCRFRTRCPYAKEQCTMEEPLLREVAPQHKVACHFAEEILGLQ